MSSQSDKAAFMKGVTVLIDTREQVNEHITQSFQKMGIMFESRKLDYGDYSFMIDGKDFSRSCVIERKADIDELYGNVTADRERIEKELDTISRNAVQCILLLENCGGWAYLKSFSLTDEQMQKQNRKVKNIGATVYAALQSWRCGNRYDFQVEFIPTLNLSATKIIELFYYYYHNYKRSIAPRKDDNHV